MPNRVRILTVPDADRAKLERRARDRGALARVAERARIVLLAAEGLTGPQIAERAGCTEPTVVKWRRQYAEAGLAGLEDAPRPGGPKTVLTEEGGQRDPVRDRDPAAGIAAGGGSDALVEPAAGGMAAPGEGAAGQPRLDHPAVAEGQPAAAPHRGVQVLHRPPAGREGPRRRRSLSAAARKRGRGLHRRKAAVPGPGTGTADPAKCARASPSGRPTTMHGVTCLFAAECRHRPGDGRLLPPAPSPGVPEIPEETAAAYLGVRLHVVCDKLRHPQARRGPGLAGEDPPGHPALHAHRMLVDHLVECFFSVITHQAIRRGSFTSVRQLTDTIGAFIDGWNDHPHPFAWTKDADEILTKIGRAKTKRTLLHTTREPLRARGRHEFYARLRRV